MSDDDGSTSMQAIRNTARLLGLKPEAAKRLQREAERELRAQERATQDRNYTHTPQGAPVLVTLGDGTRYALPAGNITRHASAQDYGLCDVELEIEFHFADIVLQQAKVSPYDALEHIMQAGSAVDLQVGNAKGGKYLLTQCEMWGEQATASKRISTRWRQVG